MPCLTVKAQVITIFKINTAFLTAKDAVFLKKAFQGIADTGNPAAAAAVDPVAGGKQHTIAANGNAAAKNFTIGKKEILHRKITLHRKRVYRHNAISAKHQQRIKKRNNINRAADGIGNIDISARLL